MEGQRYKNTEHTHTLLSGELHKRRPCIVLDAHGQQVQVIPLSTKVSIQKNPKNILMTQLPPKAHVRYKEKPVTALISMIQTVSASRIYPLKSDQGKYEHKYASYKIGSDDQFSLNNALAEQYNSVIVTKLEQLERRLENISHERNKLLIKYKDLKRRVQHLSEVELMMLKLGKDLDLGTSIEEIMKNYGS